MIKTYFTLRNIAIITLIIGLLLCMSCEVDQEHLNKFAETTFSSDFESGSIGNVTKVSDNEWDFYLADDNGDTSLPDEFRTWWYLRVDNAPVNKPVTFNIKKRGWPYYYVPVYSYDNVQWHRFKESEVSQNTDNELIINTTFNSSQVWIARFYPYTFSDLESFIAKVEKHPYLEVEIPGYTQNNHPIYLLKLTHPDVPSSEKKKVCIHTRTHPAETPGSYLVEGFVSFLLTDMGFTDLVLRTHEFYIFPMQNVDGVIAGNYRTTPKSENLEVMWEYDINNPINLIDGLPPEVNIVHEYYKNLMTNEGPKVTVALNLHASNGEPDMLPFFFPHFGPQTLGYSETESNLWNKQVLFIDKVAKYYAQMIEPIPDEGGSDFAKETYPESWWWVNFKDSVMAMTMEITYDRAGYAPERITQDNMRVIGRSLVLAINDYHGGTSQNNLKYDTPKNRGVVTNLKYPELYPPHAQDELKK